MERRLSSSKFESWCGNVLPLRLLGAAEYGNDPITWSCDSPCVQITSFADDPDGGFTDGVLLTLLAPGQSTVTASFERQFARFIRLEILSTVGYNCERAAYQSANVAIGELTAYR